MACTSDGRRAYVGCGDGKIRTLDLADGRELSQMAAHSGCVLRLRLTANETRLISGGGDGKIRIWDTANRSRISQIDAYDNQVTGLSISADGSRILALGFDKAAVVCLWDAASGARLHRIQLEDASPRFQSLAMSPDGNDIVICMGQDICHFGAATGHVVKRWQGHDKRAVSVAFSSDGRRLLTAGADRTVKLWDFPSGREIHRIRPEGVGYWSCFSLDGRQVLFDANDAEVTLAELPG